MILFNVCLVTFIRASVLLTSSATFSLCAIFTTPCYACAVLAMGLCLSASEMTYTVSSGALNSTPTPTTPTPVSVCLSVTSRCSIETAERIELVFGMWASFHPSYTVLKGNSVISKNKGTSIWYFVLNSGLRNFAHGISIVETCYQLSSRKVDAQSVINWTVVGQLSR